MRTVRSLAALLLLAAAAAAAPIEVYQARPIEPYRAKPVKPAQAETVQPTQADAVQPAQADAIQPYQGGTVEPHRADPIEPDHGTAIDPSHGRSVEPDRRRATPTVEPSRPAPTPAPAPVRPPRKHAARAPSAAELVGDWYCVAPSGSAGQQIQLHRDGTYDYLGRRGGRWSVKGDRIHFRGSLEAWDGGTGRLEDGSILFEWRSREGWQQYFAFRKG
jgi:hypothetical protein